MGGGNYTEGEEVAITAQSPDPGMKFDKWIIESGSPSITNVNESNTTLTMGEGSSMILATYTDNVSVEIRTSHEYALKIYPNPSNSEFTVEVILTEESIMDISLLDLSGRVVVEIMNNIIMNPGKQMIKVPVSGIKPGTYLMSLGIKDNHYTRLVIIP